MTDEMGLLVADLYEVAGVLRHWGEGIAAREGQTQARWQLLSVVSETALTVPSAARRLGISRQAVQRVANDLVRDGLASFQPNRDHRTSPLLELMPHGQDVLTRITARAHEARHGVTDGIEPSELASTRDVVRRITAHLRDRGVGNP